MSWISSATMSTLKRLSYVGFFLAGVSIGIFCRTRQFGCGLPSECHRVFSLSFVSVAASYLFLVVGPSSLSRASLCHKFGVLWQLSFLPSVERIRIIPYLLKHQPGSNTHRLIPVRDDCVVVAIARKCGSTSTSNVFCRKIDHSGSGEGKPFQLRKLENRSFWRNEEVNNEELKVGCLLEYRGRTCRQSFLGRLCKLGIRKRDGRQFVFVRNLGKKPQVSFRYDTNTCSCRQIFEKLTLSQCPSRFRPPVADLDPPTKLSVFQFSLYHEIIQFCWWVGVGVKTSHCHISVPVNNLH